MIYRMYRFASDDCYSDGQEGKKDEDQLSRRSWQSRYAYHIEDCKESHFEAREIQYDIVWNWK